MKFDAEGPSLGFQSRQVGPVPDHDECRVRHLGPNRRQRRYGQLRSLFLKDVSEKGELMRDGLLK